MLVKAAQNFSLKQHNKKLNEIMHRLIFSISRCKLPPIV